MSKFLGLGKTKYNSNVTKLSDANDAEIGLTERLSRKKWDGTWPLAALKKLEIGKGIKACENRDIMHPGFWEQLLSKESPFKEMISVKGLEDYLSANVSFLGHHIAHAFSALYFSPYKECLILVMDGGGTRASDYQSSVIDENHLPESKDFTEHTSLYHWDGKELKTIHKEWLKYEDYENCPHKLAEGIGSLYERAAEFIFNDNLASGKVMGLAGFGESFYDPKKSLVENQQAWDWSQSFKGTSKKEWQESSHRSYWQNLAATAQEAFEVNLNRLGMRISKEFQGLPLIFTGGCALNCTANQGFLDRKYVRDLFIPPNPGDEGISLGLAFAQLRQTAKEVLTPKKISSLNSYLGPKRGRNLGIDLFQGFSCKKVGADYESVIKCLEREPAIAWFQGRSECGPRALGHRSILANIKYPNLKDYLNSSLKFREAFRPYGASILWEKAGDYFDWEEGAHNPFMSFAVKIKNEHQELLKEVSHIDKSCRMQTVTSEASPEFYALLEDWHGAGHEPLLLNTSLNIMGEPIVETPEDVLRFFESSNINTLVFDDYLIQKVANV